MATRIKEPATDALREPSVTTAEGLAVHCFPLGGPDDLEWSKAARSRARHGEPGHPFEKVEQAIRYMRDTGRPLDEALEVGRYYVDVALRRYDERADPLLTDPYRQLHALMEVEQRVDGHEDELQLAVAMGDASKMRPLSAAWRALNRIHAKGAALLDRMAVEGR